MSMFHELMMRKKEENFLYPVIKGSLTESPEGVFSGFSSANYLQLDNVLHETEIVVKFTTSSDITSRQSVISSARLIEISIWDSYIKTWNFQSSQTVSLFSIQANTTYWVKEKITSTTKTFSISIDGINYGNDITIDDNSGTGTNTIRFGTHINNLGYGFLGSIDLNRSYIKLGSTKYNLQAVVGYTVVGSPTITDGVVSGFTTSDYIYISKFPYTKNWSITIKANTTATGVTQRCLYRSVNFQLRVNTINIWEIYASGVNKSLGQSPTSYPYVRVEKENGYISAYISQDGKTYSKVAENIDAGSVTDGSLSFSSSGDIWSGSIDFNETIIFVNNKLYFNGQQS